MGTSAELPRTADAVVVGAGAFGCHTALELAAAGARTVLLDRFAPASQTSPRAAGNTKVVRPQDVMTRLAVDSVRRFVAFTERTGVPLPHHQTGSLQVALGPEEVQRGRGEVAAAARHGVPLREVSAAEATAIAPFLRPDEAGLLWFSEDDLYLDPRDLLTACLEAAGRAGATVVGGCPVTDVVVDGDRVTGVRTPLGEIASGVVVDTAGAWSRLLAERAGLRVPLVVMRHQVLVSEPDDRIAASHPICRVLDVGAYLRPCEGGVLFGGFEADPQVHDMASKPEGFQVADLATDQAVLDRLRAEVAPQLPFLAEVAVRERRAGLPTVTPDNLPVVGPLAGLDGFLIGAGCCVGGLSISPSVGVLLADLALGREPGIDAAELRPDRFAGTTWDEAALVAACRSTYSGFYRKLGAAGA